MEKENVRNTYDLQDDDTKGSVKIADDVVGMIAAIAATEVEGVSAMGGNLTDEIMSKIGMKNLFKGVKIDVFERRVSIDMAITMEYGYNIPTTCQLVQNKVKQSVENMTGLTVTDDLGAYDFGTPPVQLVPMNYVEDSVMYYVNGTLQTAPNVTSEFPLTIEGINVPAGGNAVIIYETAVNEYAPLGENSEITNTAEITGAGLAEAVTASAAITPDNTPRLSISKSLCPATVPENGVINYSFIIQNFGTQPVTENDTVIFSDTFDPILDIDTVTFNGNTWTATNDYTYSTSTGEFVSQTGKITVPPAQYVQNPETGEWTVQPGVSTLLISGNIFTSIEKT